MSSLVSSTYQLFAKPVRIMPDTQSNSRGLPTTRLCLFLTHQPDRPAWSSKSISHHPLQVQPVFSWSPFPSPAGAPLLKMVHENHPPLLATHLHKEPFWIFGCHQSNPDSCLQSRSIQGLSTSATYSLYRICTNPNLLNNSLARSVLGPPQILWPLCSCSPAPTPWAPAHQLDSAGACSQTAPAPPRCIRRKSGKTTSNPGFKRPTHRSHAGLAAAQLSANTHQACPSAEGVAPYPHIPCASL